MKTFLSKYKLDIVCYCIVLFFLAILYFLFWGKLGNPVIDCGREAYIPSAILKGKVLYKNILNVYGPLGYQLNSILYMIFGENLNVLYIAGVVNSIIILSCVYYILRYYLPAFLSASACLLIITICYVSPGICANYIFPYSYSTYYSLTFFLLSFIFLVKYLKSNNELFIPFSFFALGTSIIIKIEYILFLPVLIIFAPFYKKKIINLISLLSFFLAPIVSMSVLFFQGLSLEDLIKNFHFINNYAKAPSMIYFFRFLCIYPNYKIFWHNAILNLETCLIIISLSLIFYFILQLINKFSLKPIFFVFFLYFVLQSLCKDVFPNLPDLARFNALNPYDTRYLIGLSGISCLLILIIQSIFYFKYKNNDIKDKIFLVLVLSFVLTNRSLLFMNTDNYGNYTFPLAMTINLIFWAKYIPLYFKNINLTNWQISSAIVIFYASIFFGFTYYSFATNQLNPQSKVVPVKTDKGWIYATESQGYCLINTLNYINNYFPKNTKFVMYPEGPMLNFLTDRNSDDHFHTLIPPTIEAYGEDFIIKKFSLNPPDYIIINNLDTFWYGKRFFGKDYAKKIMRFVNREYIPVRTFNNGFSIKIYKKKSHE